MPSLVDISYTDDVTQFVEDEWFPAELYLVVNMSPVSKVISRITVTVRGGNQTPVGPAKPSIFPTPRFRQA